MADSPSNRQRACTSAATAFWCAGWSTRWCAATPACSTIRYARNRFRSPRAVLLAAVAVAVCAVLALVRPSGDLGDAPHRRGPGDRRDVRQDRRHPAPGVQPGLGPVDRGHAGRPAHRQPTGHRQRAPRATGRHTRSAADDLESVDAGGVDLDGVRRRARSNHRHRRAALPTAPRASGPGVLVTPRGGSAAVTFLLYDGRRARVDLRHPAVVRALRLDGVAPRPVSAAVLSAIPEAPEIVPPHIPAVGTPDPARCTSRPVGHRGEGASY